MFKKLLSWLLICQLFNVNVLEANPVSTRVLVAEDSLKTLSVKVFRTDNKGHEYVIFNKAFQRDVTGGSFLKNQSLNESIENAQMKLSFSDGGVRISSDVQENKFSLSINAKGKVSLGDLRLSDTFKVKTFGDIELRADANVADIFLAGVRVLNYKKLTVNKLYLSGYAENTVEGRIEIKEEAHVQNGKLVTRGRIKGSDGSFIDCHGNDLIIQNVHGELINALHLKGDPFATYVTWSGLFSIRNVAHFYCNGSILPQYGDAINRLVISAGYMQHEGFMLSPYLQLDCEHSLLNRSFIISTIMANFMIGGDLVNDGPKAYIIGDRSNFFVHGRVWNGNAIAAEYLSMVAGALENWASIHIKKHGDITLLSGGAGLANLGEGRIKSDGTLGIQGQSLQNGDENGSPSLIEAQTLNLALERAQNDGTIRAHQHADLDIDLAPLTATGIWDLPKGQKLKLGQVDIATPLKRDAITLDVAEFVASNDIFAVREIDLNVSDRLAINEGKSIETPGDFRSVGDAKTSNRGRIIAGNSATFENQGKRPHFNKGLILSRNILLKQKRGGNKGNKSQSLTGTIALDKLELPCIEKYANDSLFFGGQNISLAGAGTFRNRHFMLTPGQLRSTVSDFRNSGLAQAKSAHLEGTRFDNSHTMIFEDEGHLGYRKINNPGEIHGNILTVSGPEGPDSMADEFNVSRVFHANSAMAIKAKRGKNDDETSSEGTLSVSFSESFENTKGSLLSSAEKMTLSGETGHARLDGYVEGEDSIEANLGSVSIPGQVVAENEVKITTAKPADGSKKPDFDMTGLISTDVIKLALNKGQTSGAINESIDLSEPDALKGLIARKILEILVGEELLIDSHLVGREKIILRGPGDVINNGEISKTHDLESHAAGFQNHKVTRVYGSMIFDSLVRGLTNSGLMLADGGISIQECFELIHKGVMEGRTEDVNIQTEKLTSDGSINALLKKLIIEVVQGTSNGSLYGKEAVDLLIHKNLETKEIRSQGPIKTTGEGHLHNKDVIETPSDIHFGNKAGVTQSAGAQTTSGGKVEFNSTGTTKLEGGQVKGAKGVHFNSPTESAAEVASGTDITADTTRVENHKTFVAENDVKLKTTESYTQGNDAQTLSKNGSIVYESEGSVTLGGSSIAEKDVHIKSPVIKTTNPQDLNSSPDVAPVIQGRNVRIQGSDFTNELLLNAKKGVVDISVDTGVSKRPIYGESGVEIDAKKSFENQDSVQSEGPIKFSGGELKNPEVIATKDRVNVTTIKTKNEKLIRGDKGVSVKSQEFEQTETGNLESPQGTVRVELPTFDHMKGTVNAKNVEFHHTGDKPFVWPEVKLHVAEKVTLHAPKGWDMKGKEKKVEQSLHLKGKILNPASLRVVGDFTWETTSVDDLLLAANLDYIVEGIFTIIHNGVILNYANLQGLKGFKVIPPASVKNPVTCFINMATFYSSIRTLFDCPMGIENHAQMEMWGNCDVRSAKGSLINHPDGYFVQRKLQGSANIFKLDVSDCIDNHNAVIYIEGAIDARSKRILNRAADVIVEEGEKAHPLSGHAKARSKSFSYTKEKPVFRKDGKGGSLFHVGGGKITAQLVRNGGSTFSTSHSLLFNECQFENFTLHFVEKGWLPHNLLKGHIIGWHELKKPHHGTGYQFQPDDGSAIEVIGKKRRKKLTEYGLFEDKKYKFLLPVPMGRAKKAYTKQSHPSFVARVYSAAALFFSRGGKIQEHNAKGQKDFINQDGEVFAQAMGVFGCEFETRNQSPFPLSCVEPIPEVVSLRDYFAPSCLDRPSFWRRDPKSGTGFQIVPIKPIHLVPLETIREEMDGAAVPEEAPVTQFLTQLKKGMDAITRRDTQLDLNAKDSKSWNPREEDVATFVSTLTPESLVQVPPRIALACESQATVRMHHHPSLLAELVMKTFMDNIGHASISRKIRSPELLVRVLEEMGYLNATRLHEKKPQSAASHWDSLSPEEKLAQQVRELLQGTEHSQFRDPAIIYRMWEDFGVPVLSAQIILPEYIRKAFQAKLGHVGAQYLALEVKSAHVDKGVVAGQKATVVKSTGNVTIKEGTLGHEDSATVIFTEETLAVKSGTVQGSSTDAIAKKVDVETLVSREEVFGGHIDQLHEKARFRATQGDLNLYAHETIIANTMDTESKKDTNIIGEKSVKWGSQKTTSDVRSAEKRQKFHKRTTIHAASQCKAGGSHNTYSQGDVILQNVTREAEKVKAFAGNKLETLAVIDEDYSKVKKNSKSGMTKTTEEEETHIRKAQVCEVKATKAYEAVSGGDNRHQAVKVTGVEGKDVRVASLGGKDIFEVATSSKSYSFNKSSSSAAHNKNSGNSIFEQKSDVSYLPEGAQIIAKENIEVQIPVKVTSHSKNGKEKSSSRETLKHAMKRLEKQEGYGWIKALRKQKDVTFVAVENLLSTSKYSVFALTPAAKALIALIMSICTAGIGIAGAAATAVSNFSTALSCAAGAMGKMAAAGFSTLMTSVTSSLITNKGNLGKTLKEVCSSKNLRGILMSMAVAGAVQGITSCMGMDTMPTPAEQASKLDTMFSSPEAFLQEVVDRAQEQAVNVAVTNGIHVATGDMSLKEAFTEGAIQVFANLVGEIGANGLCKLHAGGRGPLGYAGHKVGHFIVGGAMQAALNHKDAWKAFVTGGCAGMAGEMLVEVLPSDWSAQSKEDATALAAGLGAFFAGGDVNAAASAARNAVRNNYFLFLAGAGTVAETLAAAAAVVYEVGQGVVVAGVVIFIGENYIIVTEDQYKAFCDMAGYDSDDHHKPTLDPTSIKAAIHGLYSWFVGEEAKPTTHSTPTHESGPSVHSTPQNDVRPGVFTTPQASIPQWQEGCDPWQGKPHQFTTPAADNMPDTTVLMNEGVAVKRSAAGQAGVSAGGSRVRPVNSRMPINAQYAGKVFPVEKLPQDLRQKYPHSVPFNGAGHPDFSRYAIKKVQINVTGNRTKDEILANSAAGLTKTPNGFTWHHHQDGNTMHLVPKDIHKGVRHTGGVAIKKGEK